MRKVIRCSIWKYFNGMLELKRDLEGKIHLRFEATTVKLLATKLLHRHK
jgi:hypothetical protein